MMSDILDLVNDAVDHLADTLKDHDTAIELDTKRFSNGLVRATITVIGHEESSDE